jgi:hypothetical protein
MQGVERKCLNNRFVTVSRTASNPAFAKNISDPAEPTPMLTMPVGASVLAPVNNIHSIVTQIALNGIHPAKLATLEQTDETASAYKPRPEKTVTWHSLLNGASRTRRPHSV